MIPWRIINKLCSLSQRILFIYLYCFFLCPIRFNKLYLNDCLTLPHRLYHCYSDLPELHYFKTLNMVGAMVAQSIHKLYYGLNHLTQQRLFSSLTLHSCSIGPLSARHFYSGTKQIEHEADNSTSSTAMMKHVWSCASSVPCCHVKTHKYGQRLHPTH